MVKLLPLTIGNLVITYVAFGGGEFPHCAPWYAPFAAEQQCPASIVFDDEAIECTREAGHPGQHVEHLKVGVPLIAWLER